MPDALLLDIGNSALKFARYNPRQQRFLTAPLRFSWSDPLQCEELQKCAANCESVWLSSVNEPHQQAVARCLSMIPPAKSILVDRRMVSMPLEVDYPDQVGIDRVLAAYAAWRLFGKSTPLIVLQVGTAVTIDVVNANGAYQGGVILPSETTLYSTLAEKTDRLPRIEVDAARYEIDLVQPGELLPPQRQQPPTEPTPPLGKNTIDAIKLGVSYCVRGGVERAYRNYCKNYGMTLPVIATGGGATQLMLEEIPATFVSNLVLKALSLLCNNAFHDTPSHDA